MSCCADCPLLDIPENRKRTRCCTSDAEVRHAMAAAYADNALGHYVTGEGRPNRAERRRRARARRKAGR